jgi:hypothetical protein
MTEVADRARERFDSPRVFGSHRDLQRASSAPRPVLVHRLLPMHPHISLAASNGIGTMTSSTESYSEVIDAHEEQRAADAKYFPAYLDVHFTVTHIGLDFNEVTQQPGLPFDHLPHK